MLLSNMEEKQGGDKMCRNEKRRNDVWLHGKASMMSDTCME